MEYHSIQDAKKMSGTRLILSAGLPGPWGEAAKAILKVRGIEYAPVAQELGGANEEQLAWVGVRNAPVLVHDEEKPRSGWAEILFFAEWMGSGPSLVPKDPAERAWMMGLCHEIAGEHGIGWSGRLMIVRGPIEEGPSSPAYGFAKFFGDQYRYTKPAGDQAEQRSIDVLTLLSSRIEEQQAAGRRYLVGDSLTAADLYWAAFATLIVPPPQDQCPMTPDIRAMYESAPDSVKAAASPALLAHRDFICETALGLPFEF